MQNGQHFLLRGTDPEIVFVKMCHTLHMAAEHLWSEIHGHVLEPAPQKIAQHFLLHGTDPKGVVS